MRTQTRLQRSSLWFMCAIPCSLRGTVLRDLRGATYALMRLGLARFMRCSLLRFARLMRYCLTWLPHASLHGLCDAVLCCYAAHSYTPWFLFDSHGAVLVRLCSAFIRRGYAIFSEKKLVQCSFFLLFPPFTSFQPVFLFSLEEGQPWRNALLLWSMGGRR
jgi:hypothetical protein